MPQKKNNNQGGISSSLKNSLSKLTGKVTLKAPSPEELQKMQPAKNSSPQTKSSPKPMSAPETKPKAANSSARTPIQPATKKQIATPKAKESTPSANQNQKKSEPSFSQPTAAAGANNLADDVVIEGKLQFADRMIFNGKIKGEIESKGALAVQQQAVVEASVSVKSILVEGKVVGNITATESVRLGATAVVIGDITTGSLSVEPSANFQGRANIGSPSSTPQQTQASVQNAKPAEEAKVVQGGAPINGQINSKMPTPSTSAAKQVSDRLVLAT